MILLYTVRRISRYGSRTHAGMIRDEKAKLETGDYIQRFRK